jgi:hypothetical protein
MVLLISGRRFSRRTPPVDFAEHMRCLLRSSRIKVGPKSVENAGVNDGRIFTPFRRLKVDPLLVG